MELDIRTEQEAMRQEMLEDRYHEEQMYKDTDYFCKYVLENFKIKDEVYVDINDVLDALNKECDKYNYTIDVLLDYMKEI